MTATSNSYTPPAINQQKWQTDDDDDDDDETQKNETWTLLFLFFRFNAERFAAAIIFRCGKFRVSIFAVNMNWKNGRVVTRFDAEYINEQIYTNKVGCELWDSTEAIHIHLFLWVYWRQLKSTGPPEKWFFFSNSYIHFAVAILIWKGEMDVMHVPGKLRVWSTV